MIKRVDESEAEVVRLLGRDFLSYVRTTQQRDDECQRKDRAVPTGIKANGPHPRAGRGDDHLHRGRGRLVTVEATAELEPGVTVFIPKQTFHATESDGPEPLELVCLFSPPVALGSYEKKDR
jgi:hypothetical protein